MLKTRTRQIVVGGILLALVVAMFIPVAHRVDAKAEVEPFSSAIVRAHTGGFLREVLARAGDRVTAGQLIARLDDDNLRMRLAIAQSRAESLRIQIARTTRADDPNTIARLKLDLDGAMAELRDMQERVASLEVVSPIDGVVLSDRLSDRIGDFIARGREICEVIEPRAMRVSVQIAQSDTSTVSAGDPVEFNLAAYGRERFVSQVAGVVSVRDTVTGGDQPPAEGFRALVDLENPPGEEHGILGRFRPGMTGNASIIVGTRSLGAHIVAKLRGLLKTDLLFF